MNMKENSVCMSKNIVNKLIPIYSSSATI